MWRVRGAGEWGEGGDEEGSGRVDREEEDRGGGCLSERVSANAEARDERKFVSRFQPGRGRVYT